MKVKKTVSTKAVALILAAGLVAGGTIGGTVAWLATKTESVTNTFVAGNIEISLDETGTTNNAKTLTMVPGSPIEKDPTVTLEKGSEACWLFVKVHESDGLGKTEIMKGSVTDAMADTYITYEIADGWNPMQDNDGVYYKQMDAVNEDTTYAVLKDNKVYVPASVTKQMMDEAGSITLTFTAYAIQQSSFTSVKDAWTEVRKLDTQHRQ